MTDGTALVRGTAWGFAFFGFSQQHLWFRVGDSKNVVIESGEERPGNHCARCGATAIAPHPWALEAAKRMHDKDTR
jgi:hypothetical protein